jgi:ribosomal protein S18 acetylase RimI-like enzyme
MELLNQRGTLMTIQNANQNDLAEILALQKLAYQENAVRYNDAGIPPLTQTVDEIIMEAKSHIFLKAVINDIIIGSVRGFERDGCVYIVRLIVHPDYQNQGIGRKLMVAIEEEFDIPVFRLFTGHLDEKNISLYTKLGYVVYGEKEQVSPNLYFIHMEKRR